jgi:hypothetical protein
MVLLRWVDRTGSQWWVVCTPGVVLVVWAASERHAEMLRRSLNVPTAIWIE